MFASMLEQFGRNGADAVDLVEEEAPYPGQEGLFMELENLALGRTRLYPRLAIHLAHQLGSWMVCQCESVKV